MLPHVRPLAGAGIEMITAVSTGILDNVRPLAGAGIEINMVAPPYLM